MSAGAVDAPLRPLHRLLLPCIGDEVGLGPGVSLQDACEGTGCACCSRLGLPGRLLPRTGLSRSGGRRVCAIAVPDARGAVARGQPWPDRSAGASRDVRSAARPSASGHVKKYMGRAAVRGTKLANLRVLTEESEQAFVAAEAPVYLRSTQPPVSPEHPTQNVKDPQRGRRAA
jgi:hypothetical protein